jgi:hypothetical protein
VVGHTDLPTATSTGTGGYRTVGSADPSDHGGTAPRPKTPEDTEVQSAVYVLVPALHRRQRGVPVVLGYATVAGFLSLSAADHRSHRAWTRNYSPAGLITAVLT